MTHWHRLLFRCVNCGKNEVSAQDFSEGHLPEQLIRARLYHVACKSCGWKGEVCGFSAVEIDCGVERRTGNLPVQTTAARA
jgi:hypothetical protein